jgi:anti-sigma B factor antagonist
MSSEFEIEAIASGAQATVLRVRGRLDARSAPVLTSRCAAVRREGRHLILNLSGVSFLASSGVGALLALVEEYHQSTCRVRLVEVSPSVESVIRLLNLDQFLAIDPTEEAALSMLEAA